MGFGSLVTSDGGARNQMFSPRLRPQKRVLADLTPLDDDLAPLDGSSPCKLPKTCPIKDDGTRSVSPSTRAGSSPSVPSASEEEATVPEVVESVASVSEEAPVKPQTLREAADVALNLFKEEWVAFAIKRDASEAADPERREDAGAEYTELQVAEKYESMKAALMGLVPWLGPIQSDASGDYETIEFVGRKAPLSCSSKDKVYDKKEQLLKYDKKEQLCKAKYEWLRSDERGQAWEALCAIMSILSSRKEKAWVEAEESLDYFDNKLKKLPSAKSKKSSQRREFLRNLIMDRECALGMGYFAHYMLRPSATLRISFKCGVPAPLPASLIITTRLPLWDALDAQDDDCPFTGEAKERKWCLQAGRQFVLQDAVFGVYEGGDNAPEPNYRVDASTLKPDPKLRDLLRSRKDVVQLEVLAGLSSKEISRNLGLSAIIKRELAHVMSEAKRRGEAVVFVLGSDAPHLLAEKVYMRKPVSDHGLRCGYLRWREAADAPWARETVWQSRTCLCLQMP